jgi:transaldolase
MNQLDQLKQLSTVVADTGDFMQIARFAPQDATTNPSLILKAARQPHYEPLLHETVAQNRERSIVEIAEAVLVRFGREILKLVPGRVSTEVDARLSFDTSATVFKARRLISLYEAAGIDRSRVLIKIAATWEGIQAAKLLERQGIHCNLTLLFSMCQAAACGEARVTLISPFVGRIYDWHKKNAGRSWVEADHAGIDDPGVRSVVQIYQHYKRVGIGTEVMAASFRNIGQILALAGCDLLTISPDLLAQLQQSDAPIVGALAAALEDTGFVHRAESDEKGFRFALNEDAMATEKLAEGLRTFVADAVHLESLIGEIRGRADQHRSEPVATLAAS